MKYQIFLSISEMQPTFNLQSKLKLLYFPLSAKFICDFSSTNPNKGLISHSTPLSSVANQVGNESSAPKTPRCVAAR